VIWGATLVSAPRLVLRLLGGRETRLAEVVLRVLGARQVLQAAVTAVCPSRVVLIGGVGADGLHALSALGLAVVEPSQARVGLADAGIAATWMGMDLRALRDLAGPSGSERTRRSRWRSTAGRAHGAGWAAVPGWIR
jgi:hypothetical protein